MCLTKWSNIEDCPQNKKFIAILKLGNKIKIRQVYVHIDNNFLLWRDLRTLNNISIGKWRCIYYLKNNNWFLKLFINSNKI